MRSAVPINHPLVGTNLFLSKWGFGGTEDELTCALLLKSFMEHVTPDTITHHSSSASCVFAEVLRVESDLLDTFDGEGVPPCQNA